MPAQEDVVEFYRKAFPAIDASTRARFTSFLGSKGTDYNWLYAGEKREDFSQGDIVALLPAFFFDGNEIKRSKQNYPALVLEHTCDLQPDECGNPRNETVTYAPLFPLDDVSKHVKDPSAILRNIITTKLYLGIVPSFGSDFVADFDMVCSVSAAWLLASIADGTVRRVASLSDNGFYFLLSKLTVHLMRVEDSRL